MTYDELKTIVAKYPDLCKCTELKVNDTFWATEARAGGIMYWLFYWVNNSRVWIVDSWECVIGIWIRDLGLCGSQLLAIKLVFNSSASSFALQWSLIRRRCRSSAYIDSPPHLFKIEMDNLIWSLSCTDFSRKWNKLLLEVLTLWHADQIQMRQFISFLMRPNST